jgi:nucleoside-diphosphate-sugar epimerase
MTVAVTGAGGFIGQHVVAELVREAVNVVAVKRDPLAPGAFPPEVRVVSLALEEVDAETFALLGKPDALIHLAWGGLPNYKSLHHFECELGVHYRFAKTLVESGLQGMVQAGTCFEYGMQFGPLSESAEARPTNPYGFAKDTLRRQLEYLKQTHPFTLTWARLFYLYGEGQAPNSLFPLLKQAAARGDSVFNMSGGEQLRDYLPVEDVAKCLVRLALGKRDAGVVNVCSGTPVSVRSLVERWISENGWSIQPNLGYYPYPDYEPMAFWGSREKLDFILTGKCNG